MMPRASTHANPRAPAHAARHCQGQAPAQGPNVVLQITVRIEDREAAIARHGAQTVEALQRHIENWPSAQPMADGSGGSAPPPDPGSEPRACDDHRVARVQHGLLKPDRVRVMLGVAFLVSLILWTLIILAIRMIL